jgi:hypothetical protein
MAWIIKQRKDLADILVNSPLRQGTPIEFEDCPFEQWITLTKPGQLSNLLRIFLLYVDKLASLVVE